MKMRTMWRIRLDMRNRGMTCLIGLRRPHIRVITRRIGTRTCRIVDSQLTCTQNSLKSQVPMMICSISSRLSLPCPQLDNPLRTRSWVIPLYLSMRWSRVNNEHSIHRVQHTPSTEYTEYGMHRILYHPKTNCRPLPASLPFLGRPCCIQFTTFPPFRVNQWIES